jgi:CBS domain containing-hemolysin-like protein
MPVVAIWVAVFFASAAILSAILGSTLKHEASNQNGSEALDFLRTACTGVFGVVVGQLLVHTQLNWLLVSLLSLLVMVLLIAISQVLARTFSSRKFGNWLLKLTRPGVNSLQILFTPLATSPKELAEEFEQELHESVEEFGETIVREVMVLRIDMVTVSADATLDKAMKLFFGYGHSRLPVYAKSVDDIRGVLYIKDVSRILHETHDSMQSQKVHEVMRRAVFIPESKPVDDLLKEMQKSATHMAIIVDEYGGVAGLVTLEDVIEEIVGEISDEFDRDAEQIEKVSESSFRVNASLALFELGEFIGLDLHDDEVDSVGGLVSKQLGRLPKIGDSVIYSGLKLTAEKIEGRRKRLVSVLVSKEAQLKSASDAFASSSSLPTESNNND